MVKVCLHERVVLDGGGHYHVHHASMVYDMLAEHAGYLIRKGLAEKVASDQPHDMPERVKKARLTADHRQDLERDLIRNKAPSNKSAEPSEDKEAEPETTEDESSPEESGEGESSPSGYFLTLEDDDGAEYQVPLEDAEYPELQQAAKPHEDIPANQAGEDLRAALLAKFQDAE